MKPRKSEEKEAGKKQKDWPELEKFKIKMMTDKKSQNTIKNYVSYVRQMLTHINKSPKRIKYKDLEKYKTYLSVKRGVSKHTLYIHIKGIQAFFSFLGMDVAKELTPPKRPESLPVYLNEDEMTRMFEEAGKDKVNGPRDYAILVVLGYTGLRVSELCNLDIDDFDFSEKTIRVRGGKGDKDRIVIFEETTERAVNEYLEDGYWDDKRNSGALFVTYQKKRITRRSVENMVKKYAENAGIKKKVTPHVLRHTLATMLLKKGADIRIIQQILGHSSISTTQIYTHVDEEMLRKAYDKAKPSYE